MINAYFNKFKGFSLPVWFGLIAVFINSLSSATIVFLSLFFITQCHLNVKASGLLIMVFGIGAVVGSYLSGNLCRRYYSGYISIVSILVNALTILSVPLFKDFYIFSVLLFIMGIANSAFIPANRLWLIEHCTDSNKAKINSLRFMFFNIGMGAAIFIDGFLLKKGYSVLFGFNGIAAVLSAMILILTIRYSKNSTEINLFNSSEKERGIRVKLKKTFFFTYATLFLVSMIFSQLRATYPIYLYDKYQITGPSFSILFVINTTFIVLFQVVIVDMLHKFNQSIISGFGAFLIGLGMFILVLGESYYFAVISCLIWTIGEILSFPVLQMLLYNDAEESKKSFHVGMYQSVYSLANIIGPITGSIIYPFYNGILLWVLCGLLGCICFFISYKGYLESPLAKSQKILVLGGYFNKKKEF